MDEKKLIKDAISLLEDQVSPIIAQKLRYEADGTPYVALLQDQGIKGTKKFVFTIPEIEERLAARAALEAAEAEPESEAKAGKPKAGAKANK
jgi:hypothetical protein